MLKPSKKAAERLAEMISTIIAELRELVSLSEETYKIKEIDKLIPGAKVMLIHLTQILESIQTTPFFDTAPNVKGAEKIEISLASLVRSIFHGALMVRKIESDLCEIKAEIKKLQGARTFLVKRKKVNIRPFEESGLHSVIYVSKWLARGKAFISKTENDITAAKEGKASERHAILSFLSELVDCVAKVDLICHLYCKKTMQSYQINDIEELYSEIFEHVVTGNGNEVNQIYHRIRAFMESIESYLELKLNNIK